MNAAPETQATYTRLDAGDPAPWVQQVTSSREMVFLDKMAGRYIVLCFFASAADKVGAEAIQAARAQAHLFDDQKAAFFGVSVDKSDESAGRVNPTLPGVRFFLDIDGSISRAYGSFPRETTLSKAPVRRFWMVIGPTLRILKVFPFDNGAEREAVFRYIEGLPPPERFAGVEMQAPVLMLSDVFEPELRAKLIGLYEQHGGTESGFMREVQGRTVLVNDPKHKRRRDYTIEDVALMEETKSRVLRRIVPEIAKAHQFHVTRMERFIVSCYDAAEDGHFNPHRDNTTKGTAHRRFAVSLNLNDDYEGGELRFPEYGPHTYKPPAGAAVVFSCSLLHAANLVTRGKRYVFLPFLYDEAASALREKNNAFLDPAVGQYRS